MKSQRAQDTFNKIKSVRNNFVDIRSCAAADGHYADVGQRCCYCYHILRSFLTHQNSTTLFATQSTTPQSRHSPSSKQTLRLSMMYRPPLPIGPKTLSTVRSTSSPGRFRGSTVLGRRPRRRNVAAESRPTFAGKTSRISTVSSAR